MKRDKKTIGIYKFLDASGILENGTDEDIQRLTKQYWNDVKRRSKQEHRKEHKEYTVAFSVEELKVIQEAAKKHHRSCTRYIREAAIAYCTKAYLVPDAIALNHIRELLALNYNSLLDLDEGGILPVELLSRFEALEQRVLDMLIHPKKEMP